eukprot:scaffold314151_cov14-Tisochrysis_lutea.AAC.1
MASTLREATTRPSALACQCYLGFCLGLRISGLQDVCLPLLVGTWGLRCVGTWRLHHGKGLSHGYMQWFELDMAVSSQC